MPRICCANSTQSFSFSFTKENAALVLYYSALLFHSSTWYINGGTQLVPFDITRAVGRWIGSEAELSMMLESLYPER
jgi:hypothetical protein